MKWLFPGTNIPAPPPPPPAPPEVDVEALERETKLARQRKDLEAKRRGRRTLRIEPGLASGMIMTGLRLPERTT